MKLYKKNILQYKNMFAATLTLLRVSIRKKKVTTPINIFARGGAGFLSFIKIS